eukprot:scaffold45281_cov21-Tisochrysis_lutea.AAC.1
MCYEQEQCAVLSTQVQASWQPSGVMASNACCEPYSNPPETWHPTLEMHAHAGTHIMSFVAALQTNGIQIKCAYSSKCTRACTHAASTQLGGISTRMPYDNPPECTPGWNKDLKAFWQPSSVRASNSSGVGSLRNTKEPELLGLCTSTGEAGAQVQRKSSANARGADDSEMHAQRCEQAMTVVSGDSEMHAHRCEQA